MTNWLHFIGKSFYSIASFEKEASAIGVSRRIDRRLLKKFNFGDKVYLFHGGLVSSTLFGYFIVDGIQGKLPPEFYGELANEGKIFKVVDFGGQTIKRGCGAYKSGIAHSVTASLKELAEKAEKYKIESLLLTGRYFSHEKIKSKITFQMGYRPFDYQGFMANFHSLFLRKRKVVKGNWYADADISSNGEHDEGLIRNIQDYMKKGVSVHVN